MKSFAKILLLVSLMSIPFSSHAEEVFVMNQFKQKYSQSDLNSEGDIIALFELALKLDQKSKYKAVESLLSSDSYNCRSFTYDYIDGKKARFKKGVFLKLLKSERAWNPPQKVGEKIAAHQVFLNRCAGTLSEMGIECSSDDLKSKQFRLSALKVISYEPSSEPQKRDRQNGEKTSESLPTITIQKESAQNSNQKSKSQEENTESKKSSLPWTIAGVLIVGILALLLKTFKGKSTS